MPVAYAYLLLCADGSFYGGYTTDLGRRLESHNAGKGAKYTRSRLPVTLAYAEAFADPSAARRREYALKQLTHAQKEALAAAYATDPAEPAPPPATSGDTVRF